MSTWPCAQNTLIWHLYYTHKTFFTWPGNLRLYTCLRAKQTNATAVSIRSTSVHKTHNTHHNFLISIFFMLIFSNPKCLTVFRINTTNITCTNCLYAWITLNTFIKWCCKQTDHTAWDPTMQCAWPLICSEMNVAEVIAIATHLIRAPRIKDILTQIRGRCKSKNYRCTSFHVPFKKASRQYTA